MDPRPATKRSTVGPSTRSNQSRPATGNGETNAPAGRLVVVVVHLQLRLQIRVELMELVARKRARWDMLRPRVAGFDWIRRGSHNGPHRIPSERKREDLRRELFVYVAVS